MTGVIPPWFCGTCRHAEKDAAGWLAKAGHVEAERREIRWNPKPPPLNLAVRTIFSASAYEAPFSMTGAFLNVTRWTLCCNVPPLMSDVGSVQKRSDKMLGLLRCHAQPEADRACIPLVSDY